MPSPALADPDKLLVLDAGIREILDACLATDDRSTGTGVMFGFEALYNRVGQMVVRLAAKEDTISSQAAEIAELRELRTKDYVDGTAEIHRLESQLAAAEAERDELRARLRPTGDAPCLECTHPLRDHRLPDGHCVGCDCEDFVSSFKNGPTP